MPKISSELEKRLPFTQVEFVDATFAVADTDQIVNYSVLRPDDLEKVRWIDITPQTVYVNPTDTRGYVYRSNAPGRKQFGQGYVVLRSNLANYATRLMLFVER